MQRKHVFFGLAVLACFIVLNGFHVLSAHAATEATGMSYGATPLGSYAYRGYFKLSHLSGQVVALPIRLRNLSAKRVTVHPRVQDVLTSTSGSLQSSDFEKGNDVRLLDPKRDMRHYATVTSSIVLPAKASRVVTIRLKVPKALPGTLLGAVTFSSRSDKRLRKMNGVQVIAQVERTLFIQVDASPEKRQVDMTAPQPMNTPSGAFLMLNMKNVHATLTMPVTLTYHVTKGQKKVFSGKSSDIKMAPTSEIYYPAKWGGVYEPGTYWLNVTAKTPNQTLHKRFKFVVTGASMDTHTTPATSYRQTVIAWWLWLILVLASIICGLLSRYYRKKKRLVADELDDYQFSISEGVTMQ